MQYYGKHCMNNKDKKFKNWMCIYIYIYIKTKYNKNKSIFLGINDCRVLKINE